MKEKFRLPERGYLLNWIAENYGNGGFDNYECEQINEVFNSIETLMYNCGSAELRFLGKLFIALSEDKHLQQRLKSEFEQYVWR